MGKNSIYYNIYKICYENLTNESARKKYEYLYDKVDRNILDQRELKEYYQLKNYIEELGVDSCDYEWISVLGNIIAFKYYLSNDEYYYFSKDKKHIDNRKTIKSFGCYRIIFTIIKVLFIITFLAPFAYIIYVLAISV